MDLSCCCVGSRWGCVDEEKKKKRKLLLLLLVVVIVIVVVVGRYGNGFVSCEVSC